MTFKAAVETYEAEVEALAADMLERGDGEPGHCLIRAAREVRERRQRESSKRAAEYMNQLAADRLRGLK